MITENLSTLKIHKLSQEQYDRELENGNLDESALYLTPEVKFNKVLCDSGNSSVSVLTDGAVKIPEINNYSIFAVYLYNQSSQCNCVVLCTKSKWDGVEYITGFNNFIQPNISNSDMFFRFRGSIQGVTLTDVKAQWTDLLVSIDGDGDDIFLIQGNWVDVTVSKIVGIFMILKFKMTWGR